MNNSEFNVLLNQIFKDSVDIGFPNDVSATASVTFMSRLFENPTAYLSSFSRAQIAAGLEYIVRAAGSEMPLALLEPEVPLAERLICCAHVENIFKQIFAAYCRAALVHTAATNDEMNISCFLWWEQFPTFFHLRTSDGDALQAEREKVMRGILKIDSLACRESVIHGFGHLLEDRRPVAETMLNQCAMDSALAPELRDYARSILCGGRV